MTGATPPPPRDALAAVLGLAIDAITADVVTAFNENGVRSILVKGPALARFHDRPRPYGDADLFVAPDQHPLAEQILSRRGFEPPIDVVHYRPPHAQTWRRGDGMKVDLHRTFVGIGAEPARVWDLLAARTERMQLGAIDVEVLDPAGQALQVALHAAQHGLRVEKPIRDLERALEHLPGETWQAAAELARDLDAMPAFATGLRLVPAGAAVAARLGLAAATTPEIALRAATPIPLSRGFARLERTSGARAKAALLARELVPTPEFMRTWSPLARRGRVGLVLAYVRRPLWLLIHAVPALRAWRRAKRLARSVASRP